MKKPIRIIVWLIIFLLISLGAALYFLFLAPVIPKDAKYKSYIIHKGMNVSQIADSLFLGSFIPNRDYFIRAARISGWGKELKAGKYIIEPGSSHFDLLKAFRAGKGVHQRVTLPEGKTVEDFADIIAQELSIDKQIFLNLTRDTSLVRKLGIKASTFEGYLSPDTYYLNFGISALGIIQILVKEFHKKIDDNAQAQIEKNKLTLHEIVTLASIIEGEAVIDSERTVIAAVYINRLKRGMLLQADPTIQYIVPGPPKRLFKRDLKKKSPYNTYLYAGLPPGPVNNPGIKSILAVLNPASVKYLYFVARGDGSHIFSQTLRQHLSAKRKFDRVRARVRRQKKLNLAK